MYIISIFSMVVVENRPHPAMLTNIQWKPLTETIFSNFPG